MPPRIAEIWLSLTDDSSKEGSPESSVVSAGAKAEMRRRLEAAVGGEPASAPGGGGDAGDGGGGSFGPFAVTFNTIGLVNMVSVGFLSHYNCCEYYFSLR